MANNIPGRGGQPAKKSNITPKKKSKRVGPKKASLKDQLQIINLEVLLSEEMLLSEID